MESMYQRGKIQEESMLYEHRKHTGELPVVGVNTFLPPEGEEATTEVELMRGTEEEKQRQLDGLDRFHRRHEAEAPAALAALQRTAREGGNTFEALLDTVRVASLGQITGALFEVGGQYRRNM
jgi:methylmalonyl-CoA mutase